LDGTNHLAYIGVLVVVPGNNLNLRFSARQFSNQSLGSIEQRTVSHTNDIGRNDLVLVVSEGLGGSCLHSCVNLFLGYLFVNYCKQQSGGTGGGGNTLSSSDQLSVQLGDNQADSLGSAGAVGNDVHSACTGSSQIALSLGAIQDHLITGV